MRNWITSLLFAVLTFGGTYMLGQELGLSLIISAIAGLILWLTFGIAINDSSTFGYDLSESDETKNHPSKSSLVVENTELNEQSLHAAVTELTRQLRFKENLIEKLQSKLTEREFRRILSRFANINETLGFTLNLLQQGKLSHNDAIEQLRQEIDSAIGDLGLEPYDIQIGATVASLPPGSFVILKSETTSDTSLVGRIKEVRSTGLCVKDEDGKLHFISPSKINVYKL